MKYLQLSLLSFGLAAFMLGCGTESDEPPLVPEIDSIEILNTDENRTIHSLFIATDIMHLTGLVTYSEGPSSLVSSQLDWESNDTNIVTIDGLGFIAPVSNNGGTASISASYRDKIFTTVDKNITVESLKDINISTDSPLLTITYSEANTSLAYADVNDSGPYTLLVNGTFTDDKTISNISSNTIWTSSNTSIATIDTLGSLHIENFDENRTVDINVSVFGDIKAVLELNVTTP